MENSSHVCWEYHHQRQSFTKWHAMDVWRKYSFQRREDSLVVPEFPPNCEQYSRQIQRGFQDIE